MGGRDKEENPEERNGETELGGERENPAAARQLAGSPRQGRPSSGGRPCLAPPLPPFFSSPPPPCIYV